MPPSGARESIERGLRPGEVLLWTGTPGVAALSRIIDPRCLAFALVSLLVALSALALARAHPILIVPSIAAGLLLPYFLLVKPALAVARDRHTAYGVTNQRAIVATDFLGCTLRYVDLPELNDIDLTVSRAHGTIRLNKSKWPWWSTVDPGLGTAGGPITFEELDDAAQVVALVERVRRQLDGMSTGAA